MQCNQSEGWNFSFGPYNSLFFQTSSFNFHVVLCRNESKSQINTTFDLIFFSFQIKQHILEYWNASDEGMDRKDNIQQRVTTRTMVRAKEKHRIS